MVFVRLVAGLNAVDAGLWGPAELEESIGLEMRGVQDPELLLHQDRLMTLRIGVAQIPRRFPGPWMLALVQPGSHGGLRGPAALTRVVTDLLPEEELFEAVPVAIHHQGGLALTLGWEPIGNEAVQMMAVHEAERPLLPPTPAEATRTLMEEMKRATDVLASRPRMPGIRPEAAPTTPLGPAYPPACQQLFDRAMTVLGIADRGCSQVEQGLHSHSITTSQDALHPLRQAALDAIAAAISWPSHQMV